jgi:hypothetical protein
VGGRLDGIGWRAVEVVAEGVGGIRCGAHGWDEDLGQGRERLESHLLVDLADVDGQGLNEVHGGGERGVQFWHGPQRWVVAIETEVQLPSTLVMLFDYIVIVIENGGCD